MKIELFNADTLNFVELNITGDNNNYRRCDAESRYLDSTVFNLFTSCFENANKLYDYISPTKYNSRKIIPLRNELINSLESFNSVRSKDEFLKNISKRSFGREFMEELEKNDKKWSDHWETYLEKLKKVNSELIELTEKCADEERILWVAGY
jgi:hypothetical protein